MIQRLRKAARTPAAVRLGLIGLAVISLILFVGITFGRLRHGAPELFVSDGYFYYSYVLSWCLDFDVDFTNQYLHRPEETHFIHTWAPTAGLPGNAYAVGFPILLTPAFLLARLALRGIGDGWSLPYQLTVYAWAHLLCLGGPILTGLIFRRWYAIRSLLLPLVVLTMGSTWLAYIWFESDFGHGVSALAVAAYLGALLAAADERSNRRLAILGLTLGAAVLIRWQNAPLVLMIPFILPTARIREYARIAVPSVVICIPQMIVWQIIYGKPITMPQGSGFMNWTHPSLVEFLFSTNHGMLLWTPILIPAYLGFCLVPPEHRRIAAAALLILVLEIYVNSASRDWFGSGSFGARRMTDYLPLVAVGFFALTRRLEARPALWWAFHTICAVLVLLNLVLAVRYYTGDLPSFGVVSLERLWLDTLKFPFKLLGG